MSDAPSGAKAIAGAGDAQTIAEASRDAMWRDDRASRLLGIEVLEVGPGSATLRMTVREDLLNGHHICHGGFVATLADSAFAFACNAYNELTVAAGFDINLLQAARLGDVLTATASERGKGGRSGVYDIEVRNQRGDAVAVFRGRSFTVKGKALVDGLPVGKEAQR